jgi:uncharacterized protein YdeI (YjbR/CyaY-like superfamily)
VPQKRATKKRKIAGKTAVGPIRAFRNQKDFSAWLEKNHGKSDGLWVRIARKDSGIKSITYTDALEVALCYGWIDALKLPENDETWLQRFLPRRPKSLWSKINRGKAMALIECGRMRPPGLAQIERARADGRWESAYDSPSRAEVPPELQSELDRNPKAKAFFETLDRVNRYAIIWRIQTARRGETKQRRVSSLIAMLEKGEKLH